MKIGDRVVIDIPSSIVPITGILIDISNGNFFIENEEGSVFVEKTNKRLKKYINSL